MLEAMYWVCADVMTLGAQLSAADNLPTTIDVLQRKISTLFDEMEQRARQAGIPAEDVTEARYALAAFIDEQVLRSSWPGRQQWVARPLQFAYFNENTAGEGFFQRLAALQKMPHKAHVLEIYYLCLTLGFQGRYAIQGSNEIEAITDALRASLSQGLPESDVVSPNGEPRDTARGNARRQMPWIFVSVAVVVAALLLVIAMRVIVGMSARDAEPEIRGSSNACVTDWRRS